MKIQQLISRLDSRTLRRVNVLLGLLLFSNKIKNSISDIRNTNDVPFKLGLGVVKVIENDADR